jgi:predicted transcriptional regulator of viral defense system
MRYKNNKFKTMGPRSAQLVTTLYEKNRSVFRLKDVQEILHLDRFASSSFIRKLVDRGIVTRLKSGLFILIPFELGKESEYTGNPLVVAREIMSAKGYYLSYATAMEIHGMVTQPQLVVYVTSLKPRRPVKVYGMEFRFIHSHSKYFFGLFEHWVTKQEKVKVSNLERTIIDCLRQPEYCGGISEVAKGFWLKHESMNINRLIEYAVKMNAGSVIRRLGYLMEFYKIGRSKTLGILRGHLTETYVRLDTILPPEGKYLRKWRLQLNISPEELLSVVRT